ncbi:hypothetical protein [Bacillus sp. 37MA]|uniref:hypothetical protein n=1 Tax=Bacillus sp. 37MA TaxID=1132442 RepID=UPI0003A8EA27|nr:hypothetical protein [Bacillus sp. 37MA]
MKRKPAGKKYNDDFEKTIVDLYHSGSSIKELSSEYGVSDVKRVSRYLERKPSVKTGSRNLSMFVSKLLTQIHY